LAPTIFWGSNEPGALNFYLWSNSAVLILMGDWRASVRCANQLIEKTGAYLMAYLDKRHMNRQTVFLSAKGMK
jgi:hypothetical protein